MTPSLTPTEKAKADHKLDVALEDSFPASDPPSPTRDANAEKAAEAEARAQKKHDSKVLDEALDDSFPASDPPAIVQPHEEDESTH